MPEGPEVKGISDSLNTFWKDQTLQSVTPISGRYHNTDHLLSFQSALPLQIKEINCKGKFIYWTFENETYLFHTLGMSGLWTNNSKKYPYARIEFCSDSKTLFYHDQRNFGTMKYVVGKEELEKKLNSLGPDVFSDEFLSPAEFKRILTKGKRGEKTLAQLLMDQKVFSGIGNYLKAEILWMCKLSPHRTPNSLNKDEMFNLMWFTRTIAQESFFYKKGSSLWTYRVIKRNHELTYPSGSLAVYRRKKDPEDREIIGENTKDGRKTWWVPGHQK